MSTSKSNIVAEGFSGGNMQMTIEASKGAQALDISSISQYAEAEVLFNTGQEMLITSAEVENEILHITVIVKW